MKTLTIVPLCLVLILMIFSPRVRAQDFEYGSVTAAELSMSRYEKDTAASAVVLKEFGTASIKNGDGYELIYKYHVRIKILNKNGLEQANIEIPLYRQDDRQEKLTSLRASSFNIENGRIHEEALSVKSVFTEERNKYLTVKKLAIPNVREGSVIELTYTLECPFIFNFRSWEFQSDIPKMESEYWAYVPGVYIYNITLRGYLKLDKNESSIVKACLGTGDSRSGGSANCALMKLGMKNIPAFVEEDYMTAKKNFLSAVHFELSEIRYFDGRVQKITKEWKDAEDELKHDQRFGGQLKKGRDLGHEIEQLVEGDRDALVKAKKVYTYIKDWFLWNDTYGKYSEFGIKKAFDERKGNVGDINLSLIAAMRFAGLDAEPVILSTRANGLVVELHPVLSEFNYVVAKINIGDQVFLADATEKIYPFGMLPERCLNGKGRVIGDKGSYWIDLKPTTVGRTVSLLSLSLEDDGVIKGYVETTYTGYDAVNQRKEILSHPSEEAYISELSRHLSGLRVSGFQLNDVNDIEKAVTRRLDIEIDGFGEGLEQNTLFNPFLFDKWTDNPFKSKERLYPVDFAVPIERLTVISLEYPDGVEIVNLPERVGLSLPNGGGRYLVEATNVGTKLSVTNTLSIKKAVYSADEYHYLKELFNRILQVQNAEIILRKKS